MEKTQAIFTGDRCLSCTACMANCPVMAAIKNYHGPKLVGPAHGRMHFSQEDVEKSLDYCSNCKICDRVCPAGVAVSTLNMLQRAEHYKNHEHSRAEDMLAHGERVANLVRKIPFGAEFSNLGMNLCKNFGVFSALGITDKINLPVYAAQSFKNLFNSIAQKPSAKKIVMFAGCYVNENEPHVGKALIEVFNANGYEILFDEQFKCCGSPLIVAGFLDEARRNADNNAARILEWKKQGVPVISPCTSCSLTLKQEYHELFGGEEKFFEAATNIYDAFEFLSILQERGEFNSNFKPLKQKFLYHVPCHLKSQAIGLPAQEILEEIGAKIQLTNVDCCGMAGNYGFFKDKYEISMKIGEKLFERVKQGGFDKVISDCGTCRLQIQHGTGVKPVHPLEILAEAYFS